MSSKKFPQLVCCGGNPYGCQNLTNKSKCPKGLKPQFCCSPTGDLVPASVTMDQYGNVITVCPNYGEVPFQGYHAGKCQKMPTYSCCNNNYCYQSKDANCDYWGTINSPSIGGMSVSDCSQCGPTVSCCFPGQICQMNPKDTGCPARESYTVTDCNQCDTEDNNNDF